MRRRPARGTAGGTARDTPGHGMQRGTPEHWTRHGRPQTGHGGRLRGTRHGKRAARANAARASTV
ncbi:hypothetical protein [Actinoplanes xinjiangensis]|uniref:hypothetical protein n=1 Tax=Actinoplanes xinjiangensis TaxID=512350 RepID=UPI0011B8229D|nr:hypothetical protein [Actinoplanes xinjiangensis]